MTVGELVHHVVRDATRRAGGAPALWFDDRAVAFGELDDRISRAARAVAASTRPGDRIAILSWNRPEYVELLYGIPAAGRIAVPLNARLSAAELRAQLDETEAALVFCEPALRHLLDHATPAAIEWGEGYERWLGTGGRDAGRAAPGDPAWLLFTSGTTGRAKGALLTHRSLTAVISTVQQARPVLERDVYLYPFPLFHVSTHNILVQHRYARPVVLMRSFEAAGFVALCRAHGVTTTSLAPTMIAMLLDDPAFDAAALATLRCIGYGASAIPIALLRKVLDTLDVDLSHSYGMTEASGGAVYLSPDDHRRAATRAPHLLSSTGRPVAGVEVRIVDDDLHELPVGAVGEIAIRGAQVMAGYWRQPEATAATLVDGWLRTGDLGRFDEEGYLFVVDRKKDIIVTGGENVASREVEDAVGAHPAVSAVAVVGVPDPRWGEAVCALVVRRAPVGESDIIEHCRRQIAGYKRPRHVLFVDDLAVNASGKIDKRALRDRATAMLREGT